MLLAWDMGKRVAMHVDAARRTRCDHYREIANELRLIVPRMKHAEIAEELRLLAARYESLASSTRSSPTNEAMHRLHFPPDV